ncbi:MAG TPA: GldM family protein [Bacteroidia bacterium]|nr:GldM family protein [Bacteroidia bacterium]
MAGGKETPRQKMIGMMYLVLTALLALNISKSVLKGYIRVNESMVRSRDNLAENNKRVSEAFKNSLEGNNGARPYYQKALEAQKMFNEMVKYIEDVKKHVLVATEKYDNPASADTAQLKYTSNYDNYDDPGYALLGSEPTTPKTGSLTATELKGKLDKLSEDLILMIDKMQKTDGEHLFPADYNNLKKKLKDLKPHSSGEKEDDIVMTWEIENIYHLPMAAVIANLSKMQVEVKNAEAEVLQVFSAASGKLSIKPDRLIAGVIAPSSYIQAGDAYEADIFLSAAFSKLGEGDMEVIMGVDSLSARNGAKGTILPIVEGRGKYKVMTGAVGDQTYKGVIKFKKPDGTFEYFPFEQEYKVAPPAAAVSADQMNVFYAGVPNPVTASAAGKAPADVSISPVGAGVRSVQKGPGKYELSFGGPGECMITVLAKTKEGVRPQGPPIKFRVKPLPKPEVKVGGKFAPAEMKKGDLSTAGSIGAGASGFDFQANYVVKTYEIIGRVRGKVVFANGTGSNLDATAKSLFAGADVNSKIYIDIKVKGPDGKDYSSTCGIKVIK